MIPRSEASPVPRSVKEAVEGPYGSFFLRAMLEEIESLKEMKTWITKARNEIELDRKVIRSRWVYDYKIDKNNYIVRFKARLVAMGNDQVENIDYKHTFSPVVRIQTVRFIIALSVMFNLVIEQTDVKTAFL
jgi:hypothetical protein